MSSIRSSTNKFDNYLKEVEQAIDNIPLLKPPDPKFNLQHYIGTQFRVAGITMPQARKRFKEGYHFSTLPPDRQYPIWKYIWFNAGTHEVMTQALFFCAQYINSADTIWFFSELQQWQERIDNWAHSDTLTQYFALLHEKHPGIVFPVLTQWNKSADPWKRRQSVLSLLNYARFRKKYPPFSKIRKMVTPLLEDENMFVRKGVGWCLRESYSIYPEETYAFLILHHNKLSSVSFSTATEKYPATKKEKIKSLRKASGKK